MRGAARSPQARWSPTRLCEKRGPTFGGCAVSHPAMAGAVYRVTGGTGLYPSCCGTIGRPRASLAFTGCHLDEVGDPGLPLAGRHLDPLQADLRRRLHASDKCGGNRAAQLRDDETCSRRNQCRPPLPRLSCRAVPHERSSTQMSTALHHALWGGGGGGGTGVPDSKVIDLTLPTRPYAIAWDCGHRHG